MSRLINVRFEGGLEANVTEDLNQAFQAVMDAGDALDQIKVSKDHLLIRKHRAYVELAKANVDIVQRELCGVIHHSRRRWELITLAYDLACAGSQVVSPYANDWDGDGVQVCPGCENTFPDSDALGTHFSIGCPAEEDPQGDDAEYIDATFGGQEF